MMKVRAKAQPNVKQIDQNFWVDGMCFWRVGTKSYLTPTQSVDTPLAILNSSIPKGGASL
jgi:hypothetical protein